jgi:putative toxin-antitoxin system antitoxin component (TIGR02293 family)
MDASIAHRDLDYYRWVGVRARSVAGVVERVEEGLPLRALERLGKLLAFKSLAETASLLLIPPRTFYHRKKAKRLTPGESDRLLRAARIFGLAVDLFGGDREAARRWLQTPKRALGDATPLGYAATEVGAREVEDLIGRAEHGVFS